MCATNNPPYLLGIDAGTSCCKVILINLKGESLIQTRSNYPTFYPQSGWVEQNPEDWYRATCLGVRNCLETAGVSAQAIAGLSICGPAHTAALLDSYGQLVRPAILWSDRRSLKQTEWLEHNHGELIFAQTYQPVNPSWTLAHLLWIRNIEPDVWEQVDRLLIQKDYLTYRLTGQFGTDPYDALGTQLLHAGNLAWSSEICDLLGLSDNFLPPIRQASEVLGRLTEHAARDTGLVAGTPVAVGSGDSVVEALGVGVVDPGQGLVKLATSGAVNLVTQEAHPNPHTMTYYHIVPGRWYTVSATSTGASSADWFSRSLNLRAGSLEGFTALEQLAGQVEPGSDGLIFHPYLHGERAPHWDARLRGDFIGLTIRHNQSHFARAVLEGVAYSLRDCYEMLASTGLEIQEFHLLGGGARSLLWAQIVADVFGVRLQVHMDEAAAHGAAMVAGIAVGLLEDYADSQNLSLPAHLIEPNEESFDLYQKMFTIYREVTDSLRTAQHTLSELFENA
jgi:xylulokinase